jgi:hypothetical protein
MVDPRVKPARDMLWSASPRVPCSASSFAYFCAAAARSMISFGVVTIASRVF